MAKKSKTKKVALDPKFFISIVDADFYFSVQQAFQALGISFVDLNNGQIITGNVNIDTLGMISKLPPEKDTLVRGNVRYFLIPFSAPKHKSYDIEATINIFEPPDSNRPVEFTIQVLNQNDLEFWYKTVAEVGKNYIDIDEFDNLFPRAVFRIVPLALPDGDDLSAVRAMQGNIQRYRPGGDSLGSSVSNEYFGIPDWLDEEEDDIDEEV